MVEDSNRPLTPAQQDTLDRIRPPADERPSYPSTLRMELRTALEGGVVDTVDRLTEPLWVAKRSLSAVNGCEAAFQADQAVPFAYNPATARGQILHKSIELSIHMPGNRPPLDLVDEAMAHLEDDHDTMADFLRGLDSATRAELRGEVGGLLTTFFDTFPPLRTAWRPTTEMRRRIGIHRDMVTLSARFDLTLGTPADTTAGRVIIELKTGRPVAAYQDDLRFYALLETLVVGVPPLAAATFYLDAGEIHVQPANRASLDSALRRTIDGILRLIELRTGADEPRRRPGPPCRWCTLLEGCSEGQRWLAEDEEHRGW